MHELAITQSLLSIALEHASRAGAKRITRINLVIGDISSIVDDCVQFYFDFISKDTIAEGATLSFKRVSPRFRCYTCGEEFAKEADFTCPSCGALGGEVVAGREFFIESIEVET